MFQDSDWQEPIESVARADGPRGMGLSKAHKPSRSAASISAPVVQTPPQMAYAQGASYCKVSRGGSPKTGGGRRGQVSGRSAESRKRFMDILNQISRDAYAGALMVTLTYPDSIEPAPEKIHRDLECLAFRLRRLYPKSAAVWSQEQKVRKSGAHVGKVFYHFHLILFGVKFLDKVWISRTWFEIVGSGDDRHLNAGTQVQKLKSSRQGMAYVSKYVSKDELCETGLTVLAAALQTFSLPVVLQWWKSYVEAKTGRTWGAFSRENLPISFVFVELSLPDFYSFRRLLRHYVIAKCKKRKRRVRYRSDEFSGATAWIQDTTSLRLLLAG